MPGPSDTVFSAVCFFNRLASSFLIELQSDMPLVHIDSILEIFFCQIVVCLMKTGDMFQPYTEIGGGE